MISFLRYWLPLLIWLSVIFGASADSQSTQHTSRFLEPFLRRFWPDISAENIERVRWVVRKTAHLTEYAVLAWLWWRALRRPQRGDARPWSWQVAGLTLLAVIIYAASDEWHQSFVANRTASIRDVGIDTFGGTVGLLALRAWHRWQNKKISGTN